MFRGATKVTLDDKGRMVMPTRYREQLTEPPPAVTQAEATRDVLREGARQASERDGNLRAQTSKRSRAQKERAGLAKRT